MAYRWNDVALIRRWSDDGPTTSNHRRANVGPPRNPATGEPTSSHRANHSFRRWDNGCAEVELTLGQQLFLSLFSQIWAKVIFSGGPTLPPPVKITLGQPLLPTDYRLTQRLPDRGVLSGTFSYRIYHHFLEKNLCVCANMDSQCYFIILTL